MVPILLAAGFVAAAPSTVVRSCRAGDGSGMTLFAEPTVDGNRFSLQIDGRTAKAFTDMPNADFIGTVALSACVNHVLVFAISYGPPYLKGVAVRKNPTSHAVERIDFAEKALPRWLYLNQAEMRLVIPNIGNEVSSKYLVYGPSPGDGTADQPAAVDTLPDKRGFKVVRLKNSEPARPRSNNTAPPAVERNVDN